MTDQQTIAVQGPDGKTYQFPSDASDDEIKAFFSHSPLTQAAPKAPAPQKSWIDRALDLSDAMHKAGQTEFPSRDDINTLAKWLPTIEGTAGGVLGTVAGGPVVGSLTAGLGGAAGESQRQLVNDATGAKTTADPVQAAQQIRDAAMTQGGAELIGSGVIAPGMARAGEALMQSAIKPGIKATARALVRGTDIPIVGTLLKEGVNVTQGGIDKLTAIMKASNTAIKNALNSAPASATVSPQAVAARLDPLISAAKDSGTPEADVAALQAVKDEFLRNHGTPGPNSVLNSHDLTPVEAQKIKVATYKQIGDTPYQAVQNGNIPAARIQGQQALARGLKEDIETAVPNADIRAQNAREGAAMTARDAVATQVARAGNRDPVALAWLAENPIAGGMYILERSPAVKSMIARGLWSPASKVSGIPANVIRTVFHAIAGIPDEAGGSQ